MPGGPVPSSAEDAVRLFQLVLDNIPQFIFWKDRNSVYLGCNQNFARVAGVGNPNAIVGKTDFELAWKREEAEFFRRVDAEVMAAGVGRFQIVEPQLQAGGREAWLETSKIPLFDDAGQVVGILGMYADITEKQAAAAALSRAQRLESVGQLAGGIAHDFNNLLTGVMGFAEVLVRQLTGRPELSELASRIVVTAERAADLTRKLLAFSRRGVMQRRPVDLHVAIDNVVALLRPSLHPGTSIARDLAASRSVVMGDVTELESALLNLGLNARDAMPGGGVLSFTTDNLLLGPDERAAGEPPYQASEGIRVTVRDTGTGMTEQIRARVFEPFFTTKVAGQGTGLGLPAVYGAVMAHHGTIRVESEPGQGSAFILELPNVDASAEIRAEPQLGGFTRRASVLVIDDQAPVLDVTRMILENLGLDVLTAPGGAAGVARLASAPGAVDVAIVDVLMPEMSGRDCYWALKAIRPDLPIIMASGFTDDQLIEDITLDGAAAFLKKPFGHDALRTAIAQVLGVSDGVMTVGERAKVPGLER